MIVAIDPGPTHTAWCMLGDDGVPTAWAKEPSETVINSDWGPHPIVIEMVACYGMAVGAEVFETCVVIGRIIQAAAHQGREISRLYRMDVKQHLCHRPNATDTNIRQALIDRFGGKDKAIGKKKTPGPLYGMAGDCWAALAVAITAHDQRPAYE